MTDEDKIKLARDAAASIRPFSHNSALIQDGHRDGTDVVQSAIAALAAINALAPRLEQAEALLREVCDMQEAFCGDAITTHVRLGSKCSKIRAFLNQGKPS